MEICQNMIKVSEKEIQKSCIVFLEYLENMGKLMFLRLNSGNMIAAGSGNKRYRIKLCPKGTADLELIIQGKPIFIEFKTKIGKQSSHQIDFEKKALRHDAEYHIIRSLEELTTFIYNKIKI